MESIVFVDRINPKGYNRPILTILSRNEAYYMERNKQNQFERMTQTPIPSLIIQLSIPTIIAMLVTNIYNLVDTAFVGQLGNSASGAVGVVFGFMSIIQATGFLFGQGGGSILSRLLGQKDTETASRVASTGFFCALLLGAVIEVLGFCFLEPMVMLLGSTETIKPYAMTYITYILCAAPLMTSSFVLNNYLRYEGKAKLGMVGLLFGAVLNIILDPILMFGLNMGIAGAGLSTALSQSVSFLVLLSMFLRGKTQCRLSIRRVSRNPADLGNIVATGLPSLLRQGLSSISTVLLNSRAAVYGDPAVAAMSIASRIIFFVFSVALGIGQGFQPISAFNYGAKKYDRVRSAYRFTAILSECLITVVMLAVLVNSGSLIHLFRDDPTVIEIGTRALRLQCVSLLFLPPAMVTEMLLQSTGQKLSASLLSALRNGICFIPVLLLLSHFRGLSGIQEAQAVAFAVSFFPSALMAVLFFKKLPKEGSDDR